MGRDSRQIPQESEADAGQVAGEGAQVGADSALPAEVEAEGITVASVVGTADGRFRHAGYTILAGKEDGRSTVARRMRRLAEQIARDMAFDDFASMPAVRRVAVMAFCRTAAAADAMWLSFLHSGRLPDRFWELIALCRKYAETLGLDRTLKDAKALDLQSYIARKYGRDGEEAKT